MRIRWLAGLAPLLLAPPLLGQQTSDQARLMLTVGGGFVGGSSLWEITRQPIYDATSAVDTFDLIRRIRPTIGFIFSGSYFPGEHLGFEGEALLIGLGTEDTCHLAFASGSARNAGACASITGQTKSATAVALSGGLAYRVLSHKPFSPFGRVNLGIDISQQSTIRTIATVVDSGVSADLIVYADAQNTHVTGFVSVTAGFTIAVARGYQLRLEARDNYVGVPIVTGATSHDGLIPPHSVHGKHIFSLMLGFDVVLERRRGRRY